MTMPAPDLLAAIVAGTRRIVDVRRERTPESTLERATEARLADVMGFAAALRNRSFPCVIAECKRRSPSRGILRHDYRPVDHARAYADAGAAAISVLTEPTFFDGALEHLEQVRSAVDVPVLRKDFILTRYQLLEAAAAGADAVLLIVGALTDDELRDLLGNAGAMSLASLVEVHDERELDRALDAGAEIVGVNSRDLRTLEINADVHERLASRLPRNITAVAESGLGDPARLRSLANLGYSAFLIGERLIAQADPGAALRKLRERATCFA
jgi:indole-3-glycerol phosphate synthase